MNWNRQKCIGISVASLVSLVPLSLVVNGGMDPESAMDMANSAAPGGYTFGYYVGLIGGAVIFGLAWAWAAELVVSAVKAKPISTLAGLAAFALSMIIMQQYFAVSLIAIYTIFGAIILGIWHVLLSIGLAPKLPIEKDSLQEVFE